MNNRWRVLRLMPALLLGAAAFSCLFSLLLPPSASFLAPTATPTRTLTPTATRTAAATITFTPTVTSTPLPVTVVTGDVVQPSGFTTYFVRGLWEQVAGPAFR